MVPRVINRGYSHKGLHQYLMHDKGSTTESKRVGWTHTINIPTDDPDKAVKWLAYNSMNAERFKVEYAKREGKELSTAGRKASGKNVYSYSLSWHPSESPTKATMLSVAEETLARLGLSEHPVIIINHTDEEHDHIHVATSLVNPVSGKIATMSRDQFILSKWAEEYEQKHGVFCEKRIENNQERKIDKEAQCKQFVKQRKEKLRPDQLEHIQELYQQANDGKSFKAAMTEAGYTVCQGQRRGLTIVDEQGKIHSLSRQLNSLRDEGISKKEFTASMQAKLSNIGDLEYANGVAAQRAKEWEARYYFDRDAQEREQQQRQDDAAIELAKRRDVEEEYGKPQVKSQSSKSNPKGQKPPQTTSDLSKGNEKGKPKTTKFPVVANDKDDSKQTKNDIYADAGYQSFADESDEQIDFDRKLGEIRRAFQQSLDEDEDYQNLLHDIEALKKQIAETDTIFGRTLGKHNQYLKDLADKQQTLENANWRREEQRQVNEKEIEKMIVERQAERKRQWELGRKAKLEAYKKSRKQGFPEPDNDNQLPDKDKRYDLGR